MRRCLPKNTDRDLRVPAEKKKLLRLFFDAEMHFLERGIKLFHQKCIFEYTNIPEKIKFCASKK
jgi:hypothetical protein